MKDILLKDLKEIEYFKDSFYLKNIIFIHIEHWEEDYLFLTPTHKNLQFLQMLKDNYKDVEYIDQTKSNNIESIVSCILYNMHLGKTPEEILEIILDNSIIISKKCEGYKKYLEVVRVGKILANARKTPLRRVKLLNPHRKNGGLSSDEYKWTMCTGLKSLIQSSFMDNEYKYEYQYLSMYYLSNNRVEISFNFGFRPIGYNVENLLDDFKNENEKEIKRVIRKCRKDFKQDLSKQLTLIQYCTKWRYSSTNGHQKLIINLETLSKLREMNTILTNDVTKRFYNDYKTLITTSHDIEEDDMLFSPRIVAIFEKDDFKTLLRKLS